MTVEENAATPRVSSRAEARAELEGTVAGVVSAGRHAIAHAEIELAGLEHRIVDCRVKLDGLRVAMDELEAAGERIGGSAHG
jgi:hypothetical protein